MAVGFVASASSGSQASVASFNIGTLGTGARAGIVFVVTHNSSTAVDTGVTWNGTAMSLLYSAADTDTEPGIVRAYFLDNVTNGTITVTRTNNATVCVGYAASISAATATEVTQTITRVSSTQNTNANTSTTGTGASGEVAVDDGTPAAASMRFAAFYSGAATPPAQGTNSTALQVLDSTALGSRFVRETTAGTGSRSVGAATGTTDDWALVAVAVSEKTKLITVPLLDASPALYAPTVANAAGPAQGVSLPALGVWAPTFDCGFEDAAITTHWSVGGAGSGESLDTTTFKSGAKSLRFQTASSADRYIYKNWTSQATAVARFSMYFGTLPSPSSDFTYAKINGDIVWNIDVLVSTTNHLLIGPQPLGTGSLVDIGLISTGVWYDIELWVDGTNKVAGCIVNGTKYAFNCPSTTETFNGFYAGPMYAGITATNNVYFDDIAYSLTLADWDPADGYVNTSDAWVNNAAPQLFAPTVTPKNTLSLPLLATNYANTVLGDSPVFLLPMGEASGNLTDLVAGKSGTASGTPTYGATGPVANYTGIDYGAGTDYHSFSDHADFDLGNGGFTLEYWFARDESIGGTVMVALYKGAGALNFGVDDANTYIMGKAGTAVIASGGVVTANSVWHHVAWTRVASPSAAGDTKLYVDGVLQTLGIENYAPVGVDTADPFVIGRENATERSGGKLAFVAIYKTVLPAAKIAAHYQAAGGGGVTLFAPSLSHTVTLPLLGQDYIATVLADSPTGYWPLNETSGTAADNLGSAGATLDGTYTGTPTLGVTGIAGGGGDTAVNFDATGDYVQLTDDAALEPGTAFTWLAWVKRNSIVDNANFYSKGTGGNFYGMANGTFRLGNDGGTVVTSTSTALGDSNWHHIAVTYAGTGAGNTKVYIDGVEGHTDGAQINVGLSANANNPRIGAYFGGGEDAVAVIAHVAVVQSVLSAARIAAHYNAGIGNTSGPALFAPVVERLSGGTTQTLTIPLLESTPALYAPTVLPQPVGVTLGLLESTPALYAPTLVAKNTITLGLLDAAPALYQPTLLPTNTITLGLLDATSALYAPTLTPKNTLTVPLLESTPALYDPALTLAPYPITLPLLDAGPDLFAPTLVNLGGVQDITLDLLDAGPALYAPALTLAPYPITVPLLDSTPALYQPTITPKNTITLGQLDAAPALYAPTIIPGAVAIIVPLLDGGAALYEPTLAQGQAVTLGFLDASPGLYAPTLYAYNPIVLPFLDGAGELYAPTLQNVAVFITGITRDSNGTPLGSVEVHVFRTSDDVEVAQVTSNALGVFSIQVQAGVAHYIVAYKTGTPDRAGTTLNTLVGS